MASVLRTELKYNFLKNIIVRLDFQGVFEPELEKILPSVKPYLREIGFNRYEKKTANHFEINVINGAPPEVPKGKVQSQEIHSFQNEDRGFVLDISSSFICLNINSTKYAPFEEYSVLFSEIAQIYKKSIDFFTVKRLGIRKINICMVDDKSKIKTLFIPEYFRYFDAIEAANTIVSSQRDTFSVDNYKVNLVCKTEQGRVNDVSLYKLTLDIDTYIENTSIIENVVFDQSEMAKMNNLLFEIYAGSLTNDFQLALTNEDAPMFALTVT